MDREGKKTITDVQSARESLEATSVGKVEIVIGGNVYEQLLEASEDLRVPIGTQEEADKVVEMVMKAIALLLESRGQEIILRDPRNGNQVKYRLWR